MKLLKIVIAAVVAAALIVSPAMTQQDRRPNLRTSSIAEPADFQAKTDPFVTAFTISNEGRGRARAGTVTRGYLSTGRGISAGDHRLTGTRRTRAVPGGGAAMGRILFRIPTRVPLGTYYLIVCADDTDIVDETNDRNNCVSSGQRVTVVDQLPSDEPGPPGPAGATGPKGLPGPPGAGADLRRLPRTTLVPAEGETAPADALTVGPLQFFYECQNVPENQSPNDSARLMVRSSDGSFSVEGNDSTVNTSIEVPAGTAAEVIEAVRDDGMSPTPDDPATPNTDESNANTGPFPSGFKGGRTTVAHADGTEVIVDGYAAIDTLGAGEVGNDNADGCVFAGQVTVLR